MDWRTVADDALEPSPADSMEVELAKINERARRLRVRAFERRRQEEAERLRRQQEEELRQREEEERLRMQQEEEMRRREEEEEQQRRELEEQQRVAEENARQQREMEAAKRERESAEDDPEEGDEALASKTARRMPSTGVSFPRANRAYVLIRGKSAPIRRAQPCSLCISTGTTCVDLPNSRSKQCAKCRHQKKGCRLPGEKVQEKRKDSQLSPRGGDKRKRPKNIADDDDIEFLGSSTAKAGASASAAPESVAEVLNRHLGDITTLLRDLVSKVDNVAKSTDKGRSRDWDEDESIITDDDAEPESSAD